MDNDRAPARLAVIGVVAIIALTHASFLATRIALQCVLFAVSVWDQDILLDVFHWTFSSPVCHLGLGHIGLGRNQDCRCVGALIGIVLFSGWHSKRDVGWKWDLAPSPEIYHLGWLILVHF